MVDTVEYRKGWEDGLDRAASELRERRLYDAEAIINEVPRVPPALSDDALLELQELKIEIARQQLAHLEAEAEALRVKVRVAMP